MYIYKITNIVNNKVYIGKTEKTVNERFSTHLYFAKKKCNKYLYDAMNKYGYDNFIVEEITKCKSIGELNNTEIEYIAKYDSTNRKKGYNSTIGGTGGDTYSMQTKQRQREICKKRSVSMMGKNKGRVLTEENKRQISQTLTGRKDSIETRLKKSIASKKSQNRKSVIAKKRKSMLGHKHSEETKRKIRNSNLGKKRSKETRLNISKSNIGKTWKWKKRLIQKKK